MDKYERISCHHFVEIDGYAYFSNWFYNGLFQVELKTGKTLFLGAFKGEIQDEVNLHLEVLRWKNKICFLPRRGRYIHIYSPEDCSIFAIEVRKASEKFFRFDEVIINGSNLIFLPLEEGAPIRQFNLNTMIVTDVTNTKGIFKGIRLSQSWMSFPASCLLEKYQIEKADRFSWKQMPDGRWCGFLPVGRHLLWYIPEMQKIKTVPLTVINEEKLETYLKQFLQKRLLQEHLIENNLLPLYDYLKIMIKDGDENKDTGEKRKSVGQGIWHFVKG